MEKSVHIAIKSGLSVIEKCLRDILQATKARSESKNWLFKRRHYDLSEDIARELTVKAEEMLKEIQELQRTFEIGRDDESARWHIIGNLAEIWTMLSDLSPDKLRGYGQMRPEDGKLLTMHVDRVNEIREDMERLLSAQ